MSLTGNPGTPSAPQDRRADVELRLPADSVYVAVLRTTTASLAARLDFTLDDIEDLRMSVGEACAIVLPQADPGGDLLCEFVMTPGELTVSVGVPSQAPAAVDEDGFGWQVLSTLATDVHAEASGGRFVLTLTVRSLHVDLDG